MSHTHTHTHKRRESQWQLVHHRSLCVKLLEEAVEMFFLNSDLQDVHSGVWTIQFFRLYFIFWSASSCWWSWKPAHCGALKWWFTEACCSGCVQQTSRGRDLPLQHLLFTVMVQTAEPLVTETSVISANTTGARFHPNSRVLQRVEPAAQLSLQNHLNGPHVVVQFWKILGTLQMIWNILASDCASCLFSVSLIKHSDNDIQRSGGSQTLKLIQATSGGCYPWCYPSKENRNGKMLHQI